MPDRELTKEELITFVHGHIDALAIFDKEKVKPSLHDLVLVELNAKISGQAQIIIDLGAKINALMKHLGLKEKGSN